MHAERLQNLYQMALKKFKATMYLIDKVTGAK